MTSKVMYGDLLRLKREIQESLVLVADLYAESTEHIKRLGFPGSPELWELRNLHSRRRMLLQQYRLDCLNLLDDLEEELS